MIIQYENFGNLHLKIHTHIGVLRFLSWEEYDLIHVALPLKLRHCFAYYIIPSLILHCKHINIIK